MDMELVRRFMRLFRGSERGHGYGKRAGVYFNIDKNKWEYNKEQPGHIGWDYNPATEKDFELHLTGEVALGIGSLLDDGTTWRGEIDLDKIGNNGGYEFNYAEEMNKVELSKIPLVVSRTKSGGLRCILFFSEPIETSIVRKGMEIIEARLGWAGNEIFPKQDKLVKEDSCPSWTYLPYGPTFDKFADQSGMTGHGNVLTLVEYLSIAESSAIDKAQFLSIVGDGHTRSTGGGSNGASRPHGGRWTVLDNVAETINETFKNGPPCLWNIAHSRSTEYQHNYLFNVAIFVKRKYSENWDEALSWINFNVLVPAGNNDKLQELIKDLKHRDYEYRCKDEPICSHCYSYACRRMPFGVGNGKGGMDKHELGLVIVNRIPKIFIANVGNTRIPLNAHELMTLRIFREKCYEHMGEFPDLIKQPEWDDIIRKNTENATYVEPMELLKTNAFELEVLESYFGMHIPTDSRRFVNEGYLDGGAGEKVRVRMEEKRVYFKWGNFAIFCRRQSIQDRDVERLKFFVMNKGLQHGLTGKGIRDWFRLTYSLPLDLFDEGVVDRWLNTG